MGRLDYRIVCMLLFISALVQGVCLEDRHSEVAKSKTSLMKKGKRV
jgi:hypothetical protein